jgi:hypothetical protein
MGNAKANTATPNPETPTRFSTPSTHDHDETLHYPTRSPWSFRITNRCLPAKKTDHLRLLARTFQQSVLEVSILTMNGPNTNHVQATFRLELQHFCGCSPLLIPLANYAAPNITRSNRANRVTARGSPASQSATRIRFNAEAIAKCCKQVFAKPTYLERRNSNARTPTEMLPSIPALFAYSNLNASVSSRARAATSAS